MPGRGLGGVTLGTGDPISGQWAEGSPGPAARQRGPPHRPLLDVEPRSTSQTGHPVRGHWRPYPLASPWRGARQPCSTPTTSPRGAATWRRSVEARVGPTRALAS